MSDYIEVVYNACFGGFGVSREAAEHMGVRFRAGTIGGFVHLNHEIKRDDPRLVAAVKDLGPKASGSYANLQIAKVPADAKWHISEYDGLEHVAEDHRIWTVEGESQAE